MGVHSQAVWGYGADECNWGETFSRPRKLDTVKYHMNKLTVSCKSQELSGTGERTQ